MSAGMENQQAKYSRGTSRNTLFRSLVINFEHLPESQVCSAYPTERTEVLSNPQEVPEGYLEFLGPLGFPDRCQGPDMLVSGPQPRVSGWGDKLAPTCWSCPSWEVAWVARKL